VFDFFNCDVEASEDDGHNQAASASKDGFAGQIRDNFCDFLASSLPGTTVSFMRTDVKVKNRALMSSLGKRAVLTIDCRTKNDQTASSPLKSLVRDQHTPNPLKSPDVRFPEGTKKGNDAEIENQARDKNKVRLKGNAIFIHRFQVMPSNNCYWFHFAAGLGKGPRASISDTMSVVSEGSLFSEHTEHTDISRGSRSVQSSVHSNDDEQSRYQEDATW
jgi:hypothetical protein